MVGISGKSKETKRNGSSNVQGVDKEEIIELVKMKKSKTQTAMEYLMTYGWAILIVLVVVAALYSMGAFCMGENCAKTTMTQSDCYNGCFLTTSN